MLKSVGRDEVLSTERLDLTAVTSPPPGTVLVGRVREGKGGKGRGAGGREGGWRCWDGSGGGEAEVVVVPLPAGVGFSYEGGGGGGVLEAEFRLGTCPRGERVAVSGYWAEKKSFEGG